MWLLVQLKTIVTSQPQPIKSLLGQGWQIAAKLLVVSLLTGLAVSLGTLLLVVPGLIAAVALLPYQLATQTLLLPAGTIFALYSLLLYQQLAGKV